MVILGQKLNTLKGTLTSEIKSSKSTHFLSLIVMVCSIFIHLPYFWRKLPIKLISESQFQRGFILRASGFDRVSHGFVGISYVAGGVSYVLKVCQNLCETPTKHVKCLPNHVKRCQQQMKHR